MLDSFKLRELELVRQASSVLLVLLVLFKANSDITAPREDAKQLAAFISGSSQWVTRSQ
jgi:hypothetical protein